MQVVNCDGGCGKSELTSIPEKSRDIQPVRFTVVLDTRTMPNNNETHESDLCSECRTLLLHKYFRVKEGRVLEIPRFLEARSG